MVRIPSLKKSVGNSARRQGMCYTVVTSSLFLLSASAYGPTVLRRLLLNSNLSTAKGSVQEQQPSFVFE